ncbi:MAG: hypothetical protein HY525_00215 [Betaproteobacteria bacterium]|nr:hypothetical protein [Betaproteobacteria bacterium]
MRKKKSFFESDAFAKVLAEDVIRAKQRMDEDPSDAHRREFVRTTYSAIEAQSWQLRMYLIEHVMNKKTSSIHEISALKEESYAINDKGEIYIQPRGYSLKVGLRLVFSILKSHGIPVQVDLGSADWKNIDHAVKIRNRVIHPKKMADISVSKEEAECCYQAFVYVNNVLLATILGSALAVINGAMSGLSGKNRRSLFSSAK